MPVRYGLSTRADGNMLVAVGDDVYDPGEQNLNNFFSRHGIEHHVVCRLVHGTSMKSATLADDRTVAWGVDGLVTTEPGLFLCLTVADCFPVWFWDEARGIVAIAHAGWRGLVGGIVLKMVERLEREFAVPPTELQVAVGPGIRSCHFEVQRDVLERFTPYATAVPRRDGKTFIDLPAVIRNQLLTARVAAEHVTESLECSACLPHKYFSYRRDKPAVTETMLAYIGRETSASA